MDLESILQLPIIGKKGTETIGLGMDLNDFYPIIKHADYDDLKVNALYPNLFVYCIKDSVDFTFDILTSKLVRIDFYNNYTGKYKKVVGVGSKLRDLTTVSNDLSFDENYVLAEKGDELIVQLDMQEDIDDLDEVQNAFIKTITIETNDYLI